VWYGGARRHNDMPQFRATGLVSSSRHIEVSFILSTGAMLRGP
jgi:hypothetical protein